MTYYDNIVTVDERWTDLEPLVKQFVLPNDNCLDVGCSEGLVTDRISNYCLCCDAIESNLESFKAAEKHFTNSNNVMVFHNDIRHTSCKLDKYDWIFCLGVLHKIKLFAERMYVVEKIFAAAQKGVFFRTTHKPSEIIDTAIAFDFTNFCFRSGNKGQGALTVFRK